jgi:hypothetical protein
VIFPEENMGWQQSGSTVIVEKIEEKGNYLSEDGGS